MRILKLIFFTLITALIVAIIYANSIIGSAIERAATNALGTNVNVDFVSINPLAGSASISKIEIANPAGFAEKNAVEFSGFSAEVDIASLFSDVVHVRKLEIDSPVVLFEQKNGANNLQALYNHVSSQNSSSNSGSYSNRPSKKLIIDDLYINGGAVRLVAPQFKNAVSPLSAKIDDIHISGIGKNSNGATVGQIARILLKEISDKARNIDITKFGSGALSAIGGQLGMDADQLIKGREADVDALRGLLNSR